MKTRKRQQLFDTWASDYDTSVTSDSGFPFDGYERILGEVVDIASVEAEQSVLELGTGTGNLAARFAALDANVWGVDFSAEMLAKAKAKLPQATFVQADLLDKWPDTLSRTFDCIVSAYVLHEFDLGTKMKLLQRLAAHHLSEGGTIIVADIAFPTVQAREEAHKRWKKLWDESEYYWAADETVAACKTKGLSAAFRQLSSCGGVFVIKRNMSTLPTHQPKYRPKRSILH